MSSEDKTKLDGIATNANNYTLPVAGASLGGVKSGTDITVDASGNVSVNDDSHNHTIANVTGLQSALDGKVDDNQVLTNVPAGAVFTDTVYTHPTTTGNKHIPSGGATGQFLKWSADGTAVWSADNDTVYTHPTTVGNLHIPAGGSSGQILRWSALGTAVWGADNNTITTVNGKTGTIAKADIVALGVPAQDTVYTHPSGTNPHGTTKSDVGLSNVTNDKQMPISGGILENYIEKLITINASYGAINLDLGNVFQHTPSGNRTYTFSSIASGQAHSFTLIINMGSTVRTLTFPASVKWQGGVIPDLTTASKTYVLTFMSVDGGTTWLGMFGGEF